MATDTATSQAGGIVNFACGTTTGAGADVDVTLGFKPRHVEIFNATDQLSFTKFAAQADADCRKIAADGTTTTDGNSLVVLKGDDGDSYAGFKMAAALAVNAKTLEWAAWG